MEGGGRGLVKCRWKWTRGRGSFSEGGRPHYTCRHLILRSEHLAAHSSSHQQQGRKDRCNLTPVVPQPQQAVPSH